MVCKSWNYGQPAKNPINVLNFFRSTSFDCLISTLINYEMFPIRIKNPFLSKRLQEVPRRNCANSVQHLFQYAPFN